MHRRFRALAGLTCEALNGGIDIYAGYGMSETGPVMTITRLEDPPAPGTEDWEVKSRCRTGLPIPLVDLRIVDAEGKCLPHDDHAAGEIVVRASWVTQSDVANPEASAEIWPGGRLHTQDVARIEADGYVQVSDRLKEVIRTGGEWLSSIELENITSRHREVTEVAVIDVRDGKWGERPHVLVVVKPGRQAAVTASDIRDWIASTVSAGTESRYAIPERVTVVDALRRTSVGKVNKRVLRE